MEKGSSARPVFGGTAVAGARRSSDFRRRAAADRGLAERLPRLRRLHGARSPARRDGVVPGRNTQPRGRRAGGEHRHGDIDIRRHGHGRERALAARAVRCRLGIHDRACGVPRPTMERGRSAVVGRFADRGRLPARSLRSGVARGPGACRRRPAGDPRGRLLDASAWASRTRGVRRLVSRPGEVRLRCGQRHVRSATADALPRASGGRGPESIARTRSAAAVHRSRRGDGADSSLACCACGADAQGRGRRRRSAFLHGASSDRARATRRCACNGPQRSREAAARSRAANGSSRYSRKRDMAMVRRGVAWTASRGRTHDRLARRASATCGWHACDRCGTFAGAQRIHMVARHVARERDHDQ